MAQAIYYTTLPNGRTSSGRCRVSISIDPRLNIGEDAKLSDFPDWVNWPAKVAGVTDWGLRFITYSKNGTVSSFKPTNVTVTTPFALEPDLWQKLFPPSTKVGAFKGPDTAILDPSKGIIAPEETEVKKFLLDRMVSQAHSLDAPTADDQLKRYAAANLFEETKKGGFAVDKQLNKIAKKMDKRGAVAPSKGSSPKRAMTLSLLVNTPSLAGLQAGRRNRTEISARTVFNRVARGGSIKNGLQPELGDIKGFVKRPSAPVAPELDFHQGLTALGAHPELQRKLGLVVDLEFDLPAELAGVSEANLKAIPNPVLKPKPESTPQPETRCMIGSGVFEAAPRKVNPDLSRGLVRLEQPEYELSQLDLEGGAVQMISWVSELNRQKIQGTSKGTNVVAQTGLASRPAHPPSLRSAGLSVIRIGRAIAAQKKFERQSEINGKLISASSNTIVELDREDITRGYIYDVLDVASGAWYSLCRRQGRARFGSDSENPTPDNGFDLKEDDGWVSASLTNGFDPDDDLLRTQESIARWANGWSMVTPRPGKRLRDNETLDDGKQQVGNLKLAVSYRVVPGTLPPQRFGRKYLIRARAVDLAGNALTSEQANALGTAHALGPETYRRYEPVLPPTVLPRNPLSEGESPDVLVIRSNVNTDASATDPSQRHIFPPSIDQFRAETHGAFDGADGPRPDLYSMIVARADGAFDARNADGSFVHGFAIEDPRNYGAPYFDTEKPEFGVEATAIKPAEMPSLPDPMAAGFAFFGLPGSGGGYREVYGAYRDGSSGAIGGNSTSDGVWPNIRSIRLKIFESKGFVLPEIVGDELRVGLPKGEMFDIQLSSALREADLNELGIWGELLEAGGAEALKADVINGRHWALTPARTLRLVHAVRQPLVPTEFTAGLRLIREAGENFVTVEDVMTTSRKSTERVEARASWVDIKDVLTRDPAKPNATIWEPEKKVETSASVFTAKIDLDAANDGKLPVDERHQLHTTRHIPDIAYKTIATTRFKEFFTERQVVNFSSRQPVTLSSGYTGPAKGGPGVVPDSEKVASMDGKTVYRRTTAEAGGHYTIDYAAGRITRNTKFGARTNPMDFDVRITYLMENLTQTSVKPKLARAVSAARPAPPKVLYAVPTFKRQLVETSSEKRSLHEPVGLRVYLDRPWWSSGADEMLGVVCWPTLGVDVDEDEEPSKTLAALVTQRGQDPIWGSASTDRHVRPTDFTAAGVVTQGDLILPEAADQLVAVAGHPVHPDHSRRLWYCDIDILPGSAYTPFIKLALARYQQHSVPGLELSSVVPLSFMQLYPSRTATVARSGNTVNVAVSGRTYRKGGDSVPGVSVIEVNLEQRRPETPSGDDAVGWMPVGVAVTLTATTGSDGITTWLGSVPGLSAAFGTRYRVAIREYERFAITGSKTAFDKRLVYAEAVSL